MAGDKVHGGNYEDWVDGEKQSFSTFGTPNKGLKEQLLRQALAKQAAGEKLTYEEELWIKNAAGVAPPPGPVGTTTQGGATVDPVPKPPIYSTEDWSKLTPEQQQALVNNMKSTSTPEQDWFYGGSRDSFLSELEASKQAAADAERRAAVQANPQLMNSYLQKEGQSRDAQFGALGNFQGMFGGRTQGGQNFSSLVDGSNVGSQQYNDYYLGNTQGQQDYRGFADGTNQSQGAYQDFINGTNRSQNMYGGFADGTNQSQRMYGDIYGGQSEGMNMLRDASLGNTEAGNRFRGMADGSEGAALLYKNMAEGHGPSVAEALYRKSLQDSIAANASTAASARGGGANAAAATRAAMSANANSILGAGNVYASMRAGEQLAGAQGYADLQKYGAGGLSDTQKFGMGGFQQGQQFGAQGYGQGAQFGTQGYGQGAQFGTQGYGQGAQFGTQGYNQGQQFGTQGYNQNTLAGMKGYADIEQAGAQGYAGTSNQLRQGDYQGAQLGADWSMNQAKLEAEQRARNDEMNRYYSELAHKQQLAQQQGLQDFWKTDVGVGTSNANRESARETATDDRNARTAGSVLGAIGVAGGAMLGGSKDGGATNTENPGDAGPGAWDSAGGVSGNADDDPYGFSG